MPSVIFRNDKLKRDSVLTWILAFMYPFLIAIILLCFGAFNEIPVGAAIASAIYVYTVPMTVRYMRTNIMSITEDSGQVEITFKRFSGNTIHSGLKRDFSFVLRRDKWNRSRAWYIEVYCRGELIGKQFHIGVRHPTWIDNIASELSVKGLDVKYV